MTVAVVVVILALFLTNLGKGDSEHKVTTLHIQPRAWCQNLATNTLAAINDMDLDHPVVTDAGTLELALDNACLKQTLISSGK